MHIEILVILSESYFIFFTFIKILMFIWKFVSWYCKIFKVLNWKDIKKRNYEFNKRNNDVFKIVELVH